MASFDEELRQDALDDMKIIHSIRQQIPDRLKAVFTESVLQFILDKIAEYYVEHDTFANLNTDFVDIDIMEVSAYVQKEAEQERVGHFDENDIAEIVEMELDFSEKL